MGHKEISQNDLIKEFYKKNSNKDIPHPTAVDWLTQEYNKRTGKVFRDPDRGIRNLAQQGFLIKISKGVYRYDKDFEENKQLKDFSKKQKEQIKKRDKYRCVICGAREEEGIELHVDHIKPKDRGGKATIENDQTLCAQHNFQKKNYKQTESGKKMFIRLYELSKKSNEAKTIQFCKEILETFEKHGINGHIKWKR